MNIGTDTNSLKLANAFCKQMYGKSFSEIEHEKEQKARKQKQAKKIEAKTEKEKAEEKIRKLEKLLQFERTKIIRNLHFQLDMYPTKIAALTGLERAYVKQVIEQSIDIKNPSDYDVRIAELFMFAMSGQTFEQIFGKTFAEIGEEMHTWKEEMEAMDEDLQALKVETQKI